MMIPMKPDRRFCPRERLSLQRDFERVFAARCSAGNDSLVIYVAANGLEWTRLGIRTGAKLGTAVERNYIRRRIRESFRTQKDRFPVGYDVICLPKRVILDRRTEVADEMESLIRRAVSRWRRASDRKSESGPSPDA